MKIRVKKRHARLLLIFFGLLILVLTSNKNSGQQNLKIDSQYSPDPTDVTAIPIPTRSPDGLKKAIENALIGSKGSYAIAVKNLKTGESYYWHAHDMLPTASLYKIWVMAATYEKVQKGELKEDQILTADIADLNTTFNIASESADQTEGTVSGTIAYNINNMITISDNYTALLLSKQVTLSALTKFLQSKGLKESFVGEPPKSSAADIALFFEKLYRGQLANYEYTQKMLKLLKAQTLNGKIPKYLPEEIDIAHKTGELGDFSHDAGIIYGKKGDYIIVVLSKSDSVPGAVEGIATISRAVYDYFEY